MQNFIEIQRRNLELSSSGGFPRLDRGMEFRLDKVNKHLHCSQIEGHSGHKGQLIYRQFDCVACCVQNFYSGQSHTTRIF